MMRMKLRQERIENSDVHYDSNSSRQHSTIYTKDEEAEFFPRKYSRLRTLKWKMLHFNIVFSYFIINHDFFSSAKFENRLNFFLNFGVWRFFFHFLRQFFKYLKFRAKNWFKYLMNVSFEYSRQIRIFPFFEFHFFISKIIWIFAAKLRYSRFYINRESLLTF